LKDVKKQTNKTKKKLLQQDKVIFSQARAASSAQIAA
jgi:hypothetical protein